MKQTITIILILISFSSIGQIDEYESLWRTQGVYDSLGNFMERAKIQSFLYASQENQFYRLRTQDKINMETGETKVFIYQDTLNLKPSYGNRFEINDDEFLTFHSNDSLTIEYKGYHFSYKKLPLKRNTIEFAELEKVLTNNTMIESVENEEKYEFTYQSNGLVKVSLSDSKSEWESDYKIIDFHGFIVIQGIVSAPKLIIAVDKKEVKFLQIDYRFESKKGVLKKR